SSDLHAILCRQVQNEGRIGQLRVARIGLDSLSKQPYEVSRIVSARGSLRSHR
ncbi:MAG: hypothetical protein JWQ11_4242, partial [Rhizobacter sp.]|nr:hypothetical protein [Rhizobacter sp.]